MPDVPASTVVNIHTGEAAIARSESTAYLSVEREPSTQEPIEPRAKRASRASGRTSKSGLSIDDEIALTRGQLDHVAAYKANTWQSGLRETVTDQPRPALGRGYVTFTSAVPSRRLNDDNADRGQERTRVPGEIVNALGKLAHKITHGTGPMARDCAQLRIMLGEVARSGCISNARLRRQVDLANAALAVAAARTVLK